MASPSPTVRTGLLQTSTGVVWNSMSPRTVLWTEELSKYVRSVGGSSRSKLEALSSLGDDDEGEPQAFELAAMDPWMRPEVGLFQNPVLRMAMVWNFKLWK